MSAKLFQANAEGLPDRIHHSKFIHETAAAVHVDSFCDTELGVKWIWSIGGATWWREANVRAWGCAVLNPLRTVGKTEPHARVQGAPMWSFLPYKGLGMSNILIVVNVTKRHSPCGWHLGMFAFSFLSWDSESVCQNIRTVVRKYIWRRKAILTQRHEVSHAFYM